MERHEFENGTIIEVTNDGMLIKADNIIIDGKVHLLQQRVVIFGTQRLS